MNNKALYVNHKNLNLPNQFSIKDIGYPKINKGEIIVKNIAISIDPVNIVWISGAKTYLPKIIHPGIMHCFAVSQIVESMNDDYKIG